jgi:hypothetical protein
MAGDAREYIEQFSILGLVLAQLRATCTIGVAVYLIREAALGFATQGPLDSWGAY